MATPSELCRQHNSLAVKIQAFLKIQGVGAGVANRDSDGTLPDTAGIPYERGGERLFSVLWMEIRPRASQSPGVKQVVARANAEAEAKADAIRESEQLPVQDVFAEPSVC